MASRLNPKQLLALLVDDARERFSSISSASGRIRITIAISFADGSPVEIYVEQQNDGFVVSDLSETSRWLSNYGLSPSELDGDLQDAISAEGVDFDRGRLVAHVRSLAEIPEAIWSVGIAAVRIADAALYVSPKELRVETRVPAPERPRFRDVVRAELFDRFEIEVDVEREFVGASGTTYRPDFYVPERQLIVEALETPHATRVTRAYAELGDLQHADGYKTSSLINDESRSWPSARVELLAQVGEVFRWQERDDLVIRLQAHRLG